MSGHRNRLFSRRFTSRTGIGLLALAAIAAAPAVSFAGDRDDDRGRRYDRRDRDDHREDHDRRDTSFRVDVAIRSGSGERTPPPPRVYEGRVWVGPVCRTVCDPLWIPATYRTVTERVWVKPVVECVTDTVWIPDRYETRTVVCYERGRRVVRHERVLVELGHYDTRRREVVVSTGHWEERTREEMVCAGRWETVERRELVTPGHWETRQIACAPPPEPKYGTRVDLRVPLRW